VLCVFCLWVCAVGCVSMCVPMDLCKNAEEGAFHAQVAALVLSL
jgi:hypothetical protein